MSHVLQASASTSAPPFTSVNDFCRLSGLSRTTIYKEMNRGSIRAVRLHGRTLIDTNASLDFMRSLPAYRPGEAA